MVVYRIEKGAQDKFVIEADTGILRVAHGANLDPDRTNPRNTNYILTVIALDGGIGPDQLTAKVPVNITIVDVNNKPPIFREFNIVDVLENTQVSLKNFISLFLLHMSSYESSVNRLNIL